jgi:hypothetical protein
VIVEPSDNVRMDDRGQALVIVVVALVLTTATFGVILQLVYA